MSITVQRQNVVLDVPESAKAKYISEGYSVINAVSGATIEKAQPADISSLKIALAKSAEDIYRLKKALERTEEQHLIEVEKLKAEIKRLKTAEAKLKK